MVNSLALMFPTSGHHQPACRRRPTLARKGSLGLLVLSLSIIIHAAQGSGVPDARGRRRLNFSPVPGVTDDHGERLSVHHQQTAAVPEPAPLRIHFDYSEAAEGAFETILREEILPKAATELSRRLFVKVPVVDRLHVQPFCRESTSAGCTKFEQTQENPGECLGVPHQWQYFGAFELCSRESGECTQFPAQEGAEDADVVIYVKTEYKNSNKKCNGFVATGGPCERDPETGRPVMGKVEFNMRCWKDEEDWRSADTLETAIHEILHALFFTDGNADDFIDEEGNLRGEDNVFGEDSEGRDTFVSPSLLDTAKKQYGCQSLEGVPVDEETGHSHWSDVFQPGEVMTPSGGHYISSLTMALAEDSGWYVANWDQGATLPLVQEAGCGFLEGSCEAFAATTNGREVMCQKKEDEDYESCSGDRHTIRRCTGDKGDECRTREISDQVLANDDFETLKGNCLDSKNRVAADGFWGNYFGSNARCMETAGDVEWELDEDSSFFTTTEPRCVRMQCTADGTLELVFGEDVVACPSGENVDVSGMMPEGKFGGRFREGSRLGPCPDNEAMCNDLSPGEQLCGDSKCTVGQGQCVDGQCQCRIGYAGADCSQVTCTPSSCGPESSCVPSTGVCDPPITGPSPAPTSRPEIPTPAPTQSPTPAPSASPGSPDGGSSPTTSCCLDLVGRGWSLLQGAPVCASASKVTDEGGCQKKIPFADAESTCEAAGARLCTVEELQEKYARRAGCKANKLKAWTSTECVDKRGRPGALVAKAAKGKGAKCQRTIPRKRFGLLCCADVCE